MQFNVVGVMQTDDISVSRIGDTSGDICQIVIMNRNIGLPNITQ